MEKRTSYYLDIFDRLDFSKIIDHPNILIAANFWEEDRFRAAKMCYMFMREIDDMIDNYKSEYKVIADCEKELFVSRINQWIDSFKRKSPDLSFEKELFETLETFKIPIWTMETFAKSMIYDIHHSGFSSLEGFLEYSRGASIAPASIFVHLCGISRGQTGYSSPVYDVKRVATPCAIFSYLVHIIRDFQKDQINYLNYFADDMIIKHGMNRDELHEIALGGSIKDGFRSMIKEYCQLADQYRIRTYEMIREISPLLEPRYQLSLEIIFNLYLMVYERIDVAEGNFSMEELNPTASEIRSRVYQTICSFEEVRQRHIVAF